MQHVPNVLTISRIIITPVLLVLLVSNTFWGQFWALVLFILAAVSDYLDGKIARSFQVRSRLGQFLDPFADKILVLGTFAALAFLIPAVIPWWAVVLIGLRDAMVTLIRTWHEARGRSIRTLGIARAKTVVQLVYLILLIALVAGAKMPNVVGQGAAWLLGTAIPFILLVGVVFFTVLTGFSYLLKQEYTAPAKLNG